MNIFVMLDILLEDKLERTHGDEIDIRFTRDQAKELYETIHRKLMLEENTGYRKVRISNERSTEMS